MFPAYMLFAQDNFSDVESSGEMFMLVSSIMEAKAGYTHTFIMPFLQGDGPLTQGNNIKFNLSGEVTPISLNGIFSTVWTPIAFLELTAGTRFGTGWPINLFGGDIYGIGLNLPTGYDGSAFDSLMWKGYIGGTIQFDFAAIFPGDWNHVVFQSYHELNYHGSTRAQKGQAWFYESDDGENMNGFNYYFSFLLGYQMPIFLNTIAFQAEGELYLYDTPNRSIWGDDLIRWYFASAFIFDVTEKFSIAVIAQFRTVRNFLTGTENLYYQDRIVDTNNPRRLEFFRFAAALTYRF